jgi:hypothetical protein
MDRCKPRHLWMDGRTTSLTWSRRIGEIAKFLAKRSVVFKRYVTYRNCWLWLILLNQAMILAGRRPLLLNWLVEVYTQLQDYPRARMTAMEMVEMDPVSSPSIFRLVDCFTSEKDFVNAFAWMKRAVSLSVLSERAQYKDRLLRLAKQVAYMKDNAFRKDPFDTLPLEVIVSIIKQATRSDGDLLRYTYGTFNLKGSVGKQHKSDEPRLKTWVQRSGGEFRMLNIEGLSLTGITKLSYMYMPPFQSANTLKIYVKDNKILRRLIDKVSNRCQNLTHAEISTDDRMGWEPEPLTSVPYAIDCDFAPPTHRTRLQSLIVRNVDYRASRRAPFRNMFDKTQLPKDRKPVSYPALTGLVVEGCRFDTDPAFLPESAVLDKDGYSERKMKRKGYPCPLNLALHGAPNLESLKMLCRFAPSIGVDCALDEELVNLPNLKTAVLPSPTIRRLNIFAPELESLSFVFMDKDELRKHEAYAVPPPLVPAIEDSPVSPDRMARLTSFEVMACSSDTITSLDEWLCRMPNLKRLAVTCAPARASHRSVPQQERLDLNLLDSLIKYAFSPRLEELYLDGVAVSSAKLIAYIESRRLAGTPLRSLKVASPTMEANACAAVHRVIDFQHIRDGSPVQLAAGDPGCQCSSLFK